MPEGDAIIVVWFKLLCLAGTSNKNGMIFFTDEIPYTEEMLATEFGMEQQQRFNVLRLALNTFERFKMIEIIDNIFYISSWEKIPEYTGTRENQRADKRKSCKA
jgi:predicted phage replisome organizer